MRVVVFFFNDTATTEIYTLSLHDALPICDAGYPWVQRGRDTHGGAHVRAYGSDPSGRRPAARGDLRADRKSTRLNSSHANISYAVFCLKKKKPRHLTGRSTTTG